jgi:RNA polymerase sigma-70 factor (ECF subfamily)
LEDHPLVLLGSFPPGNYKTLRSRDVPGGRILQSGGVGFEITGDVERKTPVPNSHEGDVAERFLEQTDEDSFADLFRIFSPQLISFFRRRGHETDVAEDLAQEVMLTVYRKSGQLRDHKSFRAWLFKVARNAACRHFAQCSRQVPTVDLADIIETVADRNPFAPGSEFKDWMKFLADQEKETMTLRFVEEWEYHEIAAAQAIPTGTVKWRVFNSKKKLAPHLSPRCEILRKTA